MNFRAIGAITTSNTAGKMNSSIGKMIFCVACPWQQGTQDIWPQIGFSVGVYPQQFPYQYLGPNPVYRHQRKGMPVVYCDGHGEVIQASDVQLFTTNSQVSPLMYWSSYYLMYREVVNFGN